MLRSDVIMMLVGVGTEPLHSDVLVRPRFSHLHAVEKVNARQVDHNIPSLHHVRGPGCAG